MLLDRFDRMNNGVSVVDGVRGGKVAVVAGVQVAGGGEDDSQNGQKYKYGSEHFDVVWLCLEVRLHNVLVLAAKGFYTERPGCGRPCLDLVKVDFHPTVCCFMSFFRVFFLIGC